MGEPEIKYDDGGPGKYKALKMGPSWHIQGQIRKAGKREHSNVSKGSTRGQAREVAGLGHGEPVGQVEGLWLHPYSNRKRTKEVR